MLNVTVRL